MFPTGMISEALDNGATFRVNVTEGEQHLVFTKSNYSDEEWGELVSGFGDPALMDSKVIEVSIKTTEPPEVCEG